MVIDNIRNRFDKALENIQILSEGKSSGFQRMIKQIELPLRQLSMPC